MSSLKFVLLAAVFSFANLGFASGSPFAVMTCRETWPTKAPPVRVRTSATALTLQMNGSTFALPLARCRFSDQQIGQFRCQAAGADDRIVSIGNRFFKHSANQVQFSVTLNTGATIKSDIYTVQRTSIDGFGHPSECLVDNEYVYVRR